MRILLAHNSYQQPGGEDQVFAIERDLLEANGHQVIQYHLHNDQVAGRSSLQLLGDTLWNRHSAREVTKIIRAEKIELVHAHNTFPLISPSLYYAAAAENVPVVQTLHNYRLICPAATLFRDGHLCETCVGKTVPVAGVVHACYRSNRVVSAATASMLAMHNIAGTWRKKVSAYIAVSEFARQKFIAGGLPAKKIFTKPNCLRDDPDMGTGDGGYALFVGRLTTEKGLETLLDAWQSDAVTLPLKILGDGPMSPLVAERAARLNNVEWMGWQAREVVVEKMKRATALLVPSIWYEPFGLIAIEAFAMGLPVIASKIGALATLVKHEQTGLHFEPGNAVDLARQVERLIVDGDLIARLRERARSEYQACYTPVKNYQQLLEIYNRVRAA